MGIIENSIAIGVLLALLGAVAWLLSGWFAVSFFLVFGILAALFAGVSLLAMLVVRVATRNR
jgi:predicted Co/Zn/Cd cation transporter (cation efflux family)